MIFVKNVLFLFMLLLVLTFIPKNALVSYNSGEKFKNKLIFMKDSDCLISESDLLENVFEVEVISRWPKEPKLDVEVVGPFVFLVSGFFLGILEVFASNDIYFIA